VVKLLISNSSCDSASPKLDAVHPRSNPYPG
jgi:hypothetical protein